MRHTLLVLSTLAVLPFPGICQSAGSDIVLQDVRLIDGTKHTPFEHVSITIRNGKIARIEPTEASKAPEGAEVLKLSGKTVIPGLINGHGHLGLSQGISVSPANYVAENIESQLQRYQQYGVTTMISLGMNRDLLYQLRSKQEKDELGGSTILTADRGLGIPGGVPAVNAGPDQLYRPASAEEARKDVQEMATRDPNLIKIWVDDNFHKLPRPNPAIYGAAIDEAHKQHLRIAAHVYYQEDAKRLLQDGVDILAHSVRDQVMDPDTISLIKNRGVFYIPTLQLEESFYIYAEHPAWMDTPFFENAVNPQLAEMFASIAYKKNVQEDPSTPAHRVALETAMANLKKLHEAPSAFIAFGTDSGANPFRIQGFAEHRELELMVQAGMTPLEAIQSATSVNAKMLHVDEKTGTVEVGKQADLLVLNADPSADITNTRKIAMVFHNGRQDRHAAAATQ